MIYINLYLSSKIALSASIIKFSIKLFILLYYSTKFFQIQNLLIDIQNFEYLNFTKSSFNSRTPQERFSDILHATKTSKQLENKQVTDCSEIGFEFYNIAFLNCNI